MQQLCQHLNKRYEKTLTLQPSNLREQLCFRDSKGILFQSYIIWFLPKKFLLLYSFCLSKSNVTNKNQFLFLYVFFCKQLNY